MGVFVIAEGYKIFSTEICSASSGEDGEKINPVPILSLISFLVGESGILPRKSYLQELSSGNFLFSNVGWVVPTDHI
jgi:hypothetical protein